MKHFELFLLRVAILRRGMQQFFSRAFFLNSSLRGDPIA
jgi:hypothetical protein